VPAAPVFVRGVAADGDVLQIATTQGEVHAYDPVSKTTRVRASGLSGLSGIVTGPEGRTVVAESDAGRIVAIDKSGTVTVLAEGLDHPVGVAIDDNGTCYVSEDRLGQVVRLADGRPVIVTDGLGAPQGLAIRGDDLFTIDVAHQRLLRISLTTGQADVDAENLPVAQFADITAAVDGSLLVSAHGEGTVLRLVQNSALPQENQ
jgi:sugar lactone lactonase YvrE